jgi:hypothetical protein
MSEPSMLDGPDPSEGILAAIQRRQAEQMTAAVDSAGTWTSFAARKNLALVESTDHPTVRRIEGVFEDVECSIELVVDEDGWQHTLTTAEALGSDPSDANEVVVELHPNPKKILNTLRERLFGPEDIVIGDDDFDRRFLIHANPREAAKAMLDEKARGLVRAWCGNRLELVKYDSGVVYVQSWGPETEEAALERALEIAARLASFKPNRGATPYR